MATQTRPFAIVGGWHNKLQAAIAHIAPADLLAEAHRKMAEPTH